MNDNTLQKIKAMNDGKIAGILNQKRSNPYEKESHLHWEWEAGRIVGDDAKKFKEHISGITN